MEINDNSTIICPRCGYKDTGVYCSNCSFELASKRENIYRELYHSFISKFFDKLPFLGKFLRTLLKSFFIPGKIDLQETYAINAKYLNDLKFITTLFYFAVGSTIIKTVFEFEAADSDNIIFKYILEFFIQTYVLWIFGTLLLGFIWTGRIWQKWMKIDTNKKRHIDSVFIYEVGTFLAIIICLFWIIGFRIEEGQKLNYNISHEALILILYILLTYVYIHFIYLLILVGIREQLSIKRLITISSLSTFFILPLFCLFSELVTIPLILLPVLIFLSPIFYLGKIIYKSFVKPTITFIRQ